jgi:hypothetical protein
MSDILKRLVHQPQKLFLVDSAGALITACCLFIVLRTFHEYFGMPPDVLIYLSVIAVIFSLYSLVCFFLFPRNWRPWLRAISVANLLYCGVTLTLVIYYYPGLTIWGLAYFLAEIILVCALVYVERKVLRS